MRITSKDMKQNFTKPILLLLCLTCLINTGCKEEQQNYFQGYIEGEYLHVSSPIGGQLETLSVSRGMTVTTNDPLFTLDPTLETAAVAEAEQGLLRAENSHANITKGLRPSEIQAIEAKLEQAKATCNLTKIEYKRRHQLLEQKVIAKEVLDRTRTEMERGTAAVNQLNAELETAQLGARPDEIKTAQAEIEAAKQRVTQARWSLDQKKQTAPQNGRVFDTYYVEGEFIPAAHPVVSILPPGNIKIRFFVPEIKIASLSMGQKVFVQVDGAGKVYQASISYISPQAEYTPPVIYSRESRSKLVFMIEATLLPTDAATVHPGQPADVSLEMPNA